MRDGAAGNVSALILSADQTLSLSEMEPYGEGWRQLSMLLPPSLQLIRLSLSLERSLVALW